jgi:hypothetical protein
MQRDHSETGVDMSAIQILYARSSTASDMMRYGFGPGFVEVQGAAESCARTTNRQFCIAYDCTQLCHFALRYTLCANVLLRADLFMQRAAQQCDATTL